MTDAKMTKVSRSDKVMHGPRKVLVCGYPNLEQEAVCEMLDHEGLAGVEVVFCVPADGETVLGELFGLPHRRKMGEESRMPRAVIMGGITEKELHRVMGGYRELGLASQLWAVLTPTSETWTLRKLITELQREKMEMEKRRRT
ncbi:MAG: DUF3783 domain-containing protein [Thermodesulfobacteriota bacterium]